MKTIAIRFTVADAPKEPTPIWLAHHQKVKRIHERAFRENWHLSRFVSECLDLGIVPIMNFLKKT